MRKRLSNSFLFTQRLQPDLKGHYRFNKRSRDPTKYCTRGFIFPCLNALTKYVKNANETAHIHGDRGYKIKRPQT